MYVSMIICLSGTYTYIYICIWCYRMVDNQAMPKKQSASGYISITVLLLVTHETAATDHIRHSAMITSCKNDRILTTQWFSLPMWKANGSNSCESKAFSTCGKRQYPEMDMYEISDTFWCGFVSLKCSAITSRTNQLDTNRLENSDRACDTNKEYRMMNARGAHRSQLAEMSLSLAAPIPSEHWLKNEGKCGYTTCFSLELMSTTSRFSVSSTVSSRVPLLPGSWNAPSAAATMGASASMKSGSMVASSLPYDILYALLLLPASSSEGKANYTCYYKRGRKTAL
ncbi:Yip4p [Saccharomyces cerevisiae x Saccharomyces kudriavzevii VIN7]|uniref:Yip4p n=1 Tax=Saccharomyces cerevisiae x Saccharomyces kudriavzevii (strain VIN7) TaxID=1095631 RepID=H0GUJ8_SACCK|nr:Yip4p [Saccharomyces cerevisiae x Saccharomyces kudriavzevii VIN7]